MTELADLVRGWPGRFSRSGVLAALHGVEPPDTASLVDATLRDVVAGRDEETAVAHLLAIGEFSAVRAVLDGSPHLNPRRRATLREQLDQRAAGRIREAVERIKRLEALAYRAGLPLETEREMLEYICRESWPSAEQRLADMEQTLTGQIQTARVKLESRLGPLSPAMLRSVEVMLAEGYLREVEQRHEHGDLAMPGPVAVPRPPAWDWDQAPAEVLSWFLDPRLLHPPAFYEWRESASGPETEQFLAALHGLEAGGRDSAVSFAGALGALLEPRSGLPTQPEAVPAPDGDGYLVQLASLFTDPEIAPFRPDAAVRLFVAGPRATTVPERISELSGLTVAVGPALTRPGTTERRTCAVLETRDLLRLVAGPPRRSVTLARFLAPQWPLDAIGASPARLPRLLASGTSPWTALSWLVDLAGLGGLSRTAKLTFETGYAPRVLTIFLDLLAAPGGAVGRRPTADPLASWSDDEQLRAQVETAVLHEVRTSDVGRAAFWAALRSAPPGETVTLDDLVRTVALETDDGLEWATELEAGMAVIARLPYVDQLPDGALRLQDVGVLLALRGVAGPRMRAAVAALAAAAEQLPSMTAWAANRYALSEDWAAYDLARTERTDEPAVVEARTRLVRPAGRLVELAQQAPDDGHHDLAVLLEELQEEFQHTYPEVRLTVDARPPAVVAVDDRVARVILHELITNGAEAVDAAGRVNVTIRDEGDGELAVEVRDSGPGLAEEIRRPERAFRRDTTTHGDGHGDGLHIARLLARRSGGDVVFDSRAGDDPLFPGACLRLTLPTDSEPG
ncbi:sensor histidine kinase [Actinoplanes sp. CA-252034]|uniref:sensor histidine kinase n=1 Tax=Actinoplanes sp. CA-252034 TaxID=3239906 RepID=UPI003D9791AA